MSHRSITLLLLGILLGLALLLFYGTESSVIGGIGAWLGLPAAFGALVAHLTDPDGEMSPVGCFVWPTAGILTLVGVAWLAAGEGAICIAMILPFWIPAAVAGWVIQRINARRRRLNQIDPSRFDAVGWAAIPLALLGIESLYEPDWQTREVTRHVVIEASPEAVWPLLLSIPDVGANEGHWNLTQDFLDVPRPRNAELVKTPAGLVRKASWQRGIRFDERITRIRPNAEIGWNFEFGDDSVQRNTDRHISPDGAFLKIAAGRYDLRPRQDSKTVLSLTTTYRMRTNLPGYFAFWGELLLGDVQSNVLQIVADRAERAH